MDKFEKYDRIMRGFFMNFISPTRRILDNDILNKDKVQTTIIVAGMIALDLFLAAKGYTFAEYSPFLAVAFSWVWFLVPGLLLSHVLAEEISLWERIPVSFVISIGISTPITVIAILFRLGLDSFIWLQIFMLFISGIAAILYKKQRWSSRGFLSLSNRVSLMAKIDRVSIFLLIILVIVVGYLSYLAISWPLTGDDIAGLPIFVEVLSQNQITGTEPFHGSGVPVTPRNELIVWTYMAILTNKISGTTPNEFFVNSRLFLTILSILSLGTLLKQGFKNRQQTLFMLNLWGVYLLATTYNDGTGSNLVTRIFQDKFIGWFVVIPIVVVFMLWFVDSRAQRKLIGFGIVTLGASLVHPITISLAVIIIGGFGLIHFAIERSRESFRILLIVALVLLFCTVIPFIQYLRYTNYMPVDVAGLGDAVEYGRLNSAVSRYRLWLLGGGRFILHPAIILEPIILAAYVLSPIILLKKWKHNFARLIVGALILLPVLLYLPPFAALVGRAVTPYLIWRLAWPLPLLAVLAIGWILLLFAKILEDTLRREKRLASASDYIYPGLIIIAIILTAPRINTGLKDYNERRLGVEFSPCWKAVDVLSYLDDLSKDTPANVLSSHSLNFCIPGYAANANVVEFRGYGTVNRLSEDNIESSIQRVEDVYYFDVAKVFDTLLLNAVDRHDIDYVLVEKDKLDLDLQLKYLSTKFKSIYEDGNFRLYAVQKPVSTTTTIEANTELRLKQFENAKDKFEAILQEDPKNILAHLGMGLAYEGLGNTSQAISSFKDALSYAPDEPALYAQLAGAYMIKREFDSAVREYQTAIQLSPERPDLHRALGEVYVLMGRIPEAKASFERFASLRTIEGSAAYYTILGHLHWSTRLFDDAIQYHKKAISIEPDSQRYIELARTLAQTGEIDQAITANRTAMKLDLWNYLPHLELGSLYMNQGRLDEAIAEYETACRLKPTNVSAYILLGKAIKEKSGLDAAMTRLEELKKVNRVLPGPYRGIANLRISAGDFGSAQQALDLSAKIQPKNATILTAKGYILLGAGQIEASYEAFDQALFQNPNLKFAQLGLGMYFQEEAEFDVETGQYLQIAESTPTVSWIHLLLAETYKRQGDMKSAMDEINWAITLEPESVDGYISRAALNKAQSKWELAIPDYRHALEIEPRNVDALMGLGDIYEKMFDITKAEEMYQFAAEAKEDSVDPKIRLADIYWKQGRFTEATTLEETVAEMEPESDQALIRLANRYKTQGRIEEAKSLYERVIRSNPEVVAAYSALAQLMEEQDNDMNVVLSLYNNMLRINSGSAEAYLAAGQFFIDQGQFDLAEQILQTALNYQDVTIENYLSLSDLQQKRGQWDDALQTLETAIDTFPGQAMGYVNLANYHLMKGDLYKAETNFNKAIELNQGFVSAYVGKALIEQIKGDLEAADSTLRNAVVQNPGSPAAILALAEYQESIGRIDLAEGNVERALRLSSSNINTQQAAAKFYIRLKRYPEALDTLQQALTLPGRKMELYLEMGDLEFAKRELDEAMQWYQSALSENRGDVRPYLAIANLYQSTQDWDKALETLNTAISIEPASVESNLTIGGLYLRLNQIDEARTYFERASNNDLSRVDSLLALAELSSNLGDLEKSIAYLEQAIETSPTNFDAYAALAHQYQLSEDFSQAEDLISRGILKTINKQDAYQARAYLYENQGNWELAQADYEYGWRIAPYSKSAGFKFSDFLIRRNDIEHALTVLNQLETLTGTDSEINIKYGNIYFIQAQWTDAINTYERALDLDPTAKNAYFGLARIYELQGEVEKAVDTYQTGVENIPDESELFIKLGETLRLKGEYKESRAAFANVLKFDPYNSTALIQLKQLDFIMQNSDADLMAHIQNTLLAPSNEALVATAKLYQYQGEADLALSRFKMTVNTEPFNSENWLNLGNYYREQAQWDKARDTYLQGLKYKPTSINILLALGSVQEALELWDDAQVCYERVIEISPTTIDGYIALAKLYYQLGEAEQSLAIIKDGIDKVPIDYRGYQALGDIYLRIDLENFTQAEEAYRAGLEVLAGIPELYVRIGDLYTQRVLATKKNLTATKALEQLAAYRLEQLMDRKGMESTRRQRRALELRIAEATQTYNLYNHKLLAKQQVYERANVNYENAMENYMEALKLEPNNEFSLIGLGKLKLATGTVYEALHYFEQAYTTHPHSTISLGYIGNIYLEIGQPEKAIETFEKITRYEPENLVAQFGLSNAYQELETLNISEAAASVERSVFRFPALVNYYRSLEN
jgi:tetratricopeptide (TPR) repeat protein